MKRGHSGTCGKLGVEEDDGWETVAGVGGEVETAAGVDMVWLATAVAAVVSRTTGEWL